MPVNKSLISVDVREDETLIRLKHTLWKRLPLFAGWLLFLSSPFLFAFGLQVYKVEIQPTHPTPETKILK